MAVFTSQFNQARLLHLVDRRRQAHVIGDVISAFLRAVALAMSSVTTAEHTVVAAHYATVDNLVVAVMLIPMGLGVLGITRVVEDSQDGFVNGLAVVESSSTYIQRLGF